MPLVFYYSHTTMAKSRDDNPIRRAASVIAWHLTRHHTESEATARAWEHEPGLSEREMSEALQWARDSLAFADAFTLACDLCEESCDENGELPPPGKCHKAAETDVYELMRKFNLPRG